MTLRYKLGLTGTKLGCDRAECGACTVLVDDVPHYSCSVLAQRERQEGREHRGLAKPDGTLHPVQQAVVQGQGFSAPSACRLRDGHGRLSQDQSESDARTTRPWHFGQPVSLRRLRQDSRLHGPRSRTLEGRNMEQEKPAAPVISAGSKVVQAARPELRDARSRGQGHRPREIRRRLSRRRHGVHQADAEPASACAHRQHRCLRRARDARRAWHSDRRRSAAPPPPPAPPAAAAPPAKAEGAPPAADNTDSPPPPKSLGRGRRRRSGRAGRAAASRHSDGTHDAASRCAQRRRCPRNSR